MIIGIDASNLRLGGGVSHISDLILAAESIHVKDFGAVIIWAGQRLIAQLPQRPWLRVVYEPKLQSIHSYQNLVAICPTASFVSQHSM